MNIDFQGSDNPARDTLWQKASEILSKGIVKDLEAERSSNTIPEHQWQHLAKAIATGQPSALSTQVQGDHYKKLKIQPVEFIHANNIPFIEGNVIKYVTRWREKGGVKDLEKAKHFIDLLIELETKNARKTD